MVRKTVNNLCFRSDKHQEFLRSRGAQLRQTALEQWYAKVTSPKEAKPKVKKEVKPKPVKVKIENVGPKAKRQRKHSTRDLERAIKYYADNPHAKELKLMRLEDKQ